MEQNARGEAFAGILDVNLNGRADSRPSGVPDRVTETILEWVVANASFPTVFAPPPALG